MIRRWFALAGLVAAAFVLAVAGCQTSEYPAPIRGTTYRLDQDVPTEGSEIRIDVLGTWDECVEAKVEDIDACLPWADRSSGELHFSFILRDSQVFTELARSIADDQIRVTHDKTTLSKIELIPHEPVRSGQLFIVLIDGSSSMFESTENGVERIRKVYSALLKPSVIDGFYPAESSKTGVVLLRFNQGVTGLDGGAPTVLRTRQEYVSTIKRFLLNRSGGYTHLYDAVKYTVTDLMEVDSIRSFLATRVAQPSVVVVTDGFNNERADDLCSTNVPRLQSALDVLREVRTSQGGATRPTVFTVGLGTPYRKQNKPKGLNRQVTAQDLCGQYADFRIDKVLDSKGIDHVSMQWIAEAGGGRSFVRDKANGLAEVLEVAAATRYRWFELWYRVPESFYHRTSFDVGLELDLTEKGSTSFTVHPGGWLDGPVGVHESGANWHSPAPFRDTFTILMPALGIAVMLNYVGPAMFNARRALFRRARPRKQG